MKLILKIFQRTSKNIARQKKSWKAPIKKKKWFEDFCWP